MSNQLVRQTIVAEIERAKGLWNAGGYGYQLVVDYENRQDVDLAQQINPFMQVDIVFLASRQIDMNPAPRLSDDGQIVIALGMKAGGGTQKLEQLRDFIRPFLQLRDNLANGVRTHASQPYPPKPVNGFYYLPLVTGFWCVTVAPAVP